MAKERFRDRRGLLITTDIVLAIVDAVLIIVVISGGIGFGGFAGAGDQAPAQSEAQEEPQETANESTEAAARDEAPPAEQEATADQEEPEPQEETSPERAPRPDERRTQRVYTVTRGDTFFGLTARIWEDSHLWPDLYNLNRDNFSNPDLILPGQQVSIYPSLKDDGRLSDVERSHLMDAYIQTYRRYRSLGNEWLDRAARSGDRYPRRQGRIFIDKAQWLLYSGLRYSQSYLERYSDSINAEDAAVVDSYVERFGYPEP